MRPLRVAVPALVATVALALVPTLVPPYYANLMIPFFGYAIALLGFNLLFGQANLLSFGHAMFLGFGAYGAAVLSGVLGVRSRSSWSPARCSPRSSPCRSASCACATPASSSAC